MSGNHGFASAIGARAVVLSAPVRRALLSAVLVAGALFAVWLASATPAHAAQAAERSSGEGLFGQVEQASGLGALAQNRTSVAGTPEQGRAEHGAAEDRGGEPGGNRSGVVTPVATALDRQPLSGAVAGVGERTSHAVQAASDSVSTPVAEGADVAERIREAIRHGQPEHAHDPAVELDRDDADGPTDGVEEAPEADVAVLPELVVHALQHPVDGADAHAPDSADEVAPDADGKDERHRAVVDSARSAVASSSSAPGGAVGGVGVAGFLSAATAPAPSPGPLQAAWHVLRAAPADSADEPTFSPD
ncbi:hypothetical protein BJF83_16790 [Nocardiopsis sp. CNR-923]|uniref:hypothetical protein n=1 Tax=Nocardiopsis sp. CNR-923 TaxID=1904965 RepID=UPI00095E23C8|nr:hypothetical protein [Nocardiopsis sp. CNR-923]OLT27973.1 hypothetical protein BJF83_16790 [Nocardiopsis sp. CNR-923]